MIVMMVEVSIDIMTPNSLRIFRIGRIFRVLVVLDTKYCGGVRRMSREILRSLPQILDIIGLLLFIILIYSLLGFYLFGATDDHGAGVVVTAAVLCSGSVSVTLSSELTLPLPPSRNVNVRLLSLTYPSYLSRVLYGTRARSLGFPRTESRPKSDLRFFDFWSCCILSLKLTLYP